MEGFILLIAMLLIIVITAISCFHCLIHRCILGVLNDEPEIPVVEADIVEDVLEDDIPVIEIVIDQ